MSIGTAKYSPKRSRRSSDSARSVSEPGRDPHNPRAMEITERSATDLACAIRDGELTSRAVVEAHVERARHLNPALQAIAADPFEAALAEADAADERVAAWRAARGAGTDGGRVTDAGGRADPSALDSRAGA